MEFEVPLKKATEVRRWAEKEGAELLAPNHPGTFTSEHCTVQVLGNEPLVVSVLRQKDAEGKLIPTTLSTAMMRIITSDKIAEQEGFKKIISPDSQSESKRPRFDLTPIPLDRSKLPTREEVEKSLRKSETKLKRELERRRKGLYSNDSRLDNIIINI